jgi:antibiotic biosynthesis monooxygenase (ABM) superfamily enzyme
MVVYEVSVELDATIRADYLAWLRAHIDEICALPGFTGAQVFEVAEPAPADGRVSLCVQYRLVDAAALDAYLREHAPRLRTDGVARFGDRFRAQRRVLRTLAT